MDEQQVKDIFKTISKKYESSNLIISLGLEKYWRSRFESLIKGNETHILDACCGTGNSTFAIWKRTKRKADITGLDFSPEMLEIAREKVKNFTKQNEGNNKSRSYDGKISFIESDVTSSPLKDGYFDLVTIIFGIRNIIDRKKALEELYRVSVPGARILIMEFNMPENIILRKLYIFYMNKVLLKMGTIVTKNKDAYLHLVQSIREFPKVKSFETLMEKSGWKKIRSLRMSFNTCIIYEGHKT